MRVSSHSFDNSFSIVCSAVSFSPSMMSPAYNRIHMRSLSSTEIPFPTALILSAKSFMKQLNSKGEWTTST